MTNRLFVRNLSPETTEDEVYALFAKVGCVNLILFLTDRRTGESKGHCIIDMETVDLADSAMRKLNGSLLHGQALQVFGTDSPHRSSAFR